LICLAAALALAAVLPAFANPPETRIDPKLQANIQAALPRQAKLIEEAVKRLAPPRSGVHDLYFVGFAGFGDQAVFRKEVERVRELFDARFDTRGHSLLLVNNPGTLTRYPLATLRNLRTVLAEIGKRFDPEKDVLFLFVTSHGEQRSGLSVRLNGRDLGSITPKRLAEALNAAGIKKRVIVVSSCFSGQFIPALANDDSLVMTASAADRSSFGCSTDAEWTWFGESYFVEALPKHGKFVPAFAHAKELVSNRELWEKAQPSLPQISVGPAIERLLEKLGY
jgi:hypothetical protein